MASLSRPADPSPFLLRQMLPTVEKPVRLRLSGKCRFFLGTTEVSREEFNHKRRNVTMIEQDDDGFVIRLVAEPEMGQ